MLKALRHVLVVASLLPFTSATEVAFPLCSCDNGDTFWSVDSILQCQKVSDFFIATAYFSIPIELLYFVTCTSVFPFKWVLFQFGAFIVLCGLTHLLSIFTYGPHTFSMMLSLTISKLLTALVSFATAITLLTLIPQLLSVKVRENFLWIKARELDREVGLMKRQEEARWHVRMLTQEIRKSLNKHTILYTTLVQLSGILGLQNCAVWMPEEESGEMKLTHQLRPRSSLDDFEPSISVDDPDVVEIKESKGVKILMSDSALGSVSSRGGEPEAVAAIRVPMLKASNFKGGTPELMQTPFAILVLVFPGDDNRSWSHNEFEIIEVVADQVALALSHAAVLEESQSMKDMLEEKNRVLLQAKQKAVMACEARNTFQRIMSQDMKKPIHSILGLLSMMQQDNFSPEQRLMITSTTKAGMLVSTLINDVMETTIANSERLSVEMKPFELHSTIKEAAGVARSLCDSRSFGFGIQVENVVPNWVIGDEKRMFHVLLHIFGSIIKGCDDGFLMFRVVSLVDTEGLQDQDKSPWMLNSSHASYASVKFEIEIKGFEAGDSGYVQPSKRPNCKELEMSYGFIMCKKLVQMMQGYLSVLPNDDGLLDSMVLVLRFQQHQLEPTAEPGESFDRHCSPNIRHFKGLRLLLAEDDSVSRAMTRRLLEKLGFHVFSVSSIIQCLSYLASSGTPFHVIILDLDTAEVDGFEAAVRIRKLTGSWPPVIGLMGSAIEDIWEKCSQSGINGVIRKPLMLQAMCDELRRILKNS